MSPSLLALEWDPPSWIALLLALLAMLLAALALRKKKKDRVRPFHRFRLVNKSPRQVALSSVSGTHEGSGTGGAALPGTAIAPPPLPAWNGTGLPSNRTREWLDLNLGPDHLRSLRLQIQAVGDASAQPVPYVQSATTDPSVPWHELKVVEMALTAVDASMPHFGYTFTVTATRYVQGGTADDYEDVEFTISHPASP